MEDLPEDVVVIIFQKLGVKTLGHCMCVNRGWRSLIKSCSFVSSYDKKKKQHPCKYSIHWSDGKFKLRVSNDIRFYFKELDPPPVKLFPYNLSIKSSMCDGVLCIPTDKFRVILWNPIIQLLLPLPKPIFIPRCRPDDICNLLHGFAFDALANDYKILRVIQFDNRFHAEIFSFNTFSWKDVSHNVLQRYHHFYWERLHPYFNGAVHTICRTSWANSDECSIVSFDINAEESQEIIKLPRSFTSTRSHFVLEVYKDSFIAFCCIESHFTELWLMKEYGNIDSFENIWKFDLSQISVTLPFRVGAFGIRNDCQVWFSVLKPPEIIGRRLFSIDLNDNNKVHECAIDSTNWHAFHFEESLFLLDTSKARNCLKFQEKLLHAPEKRRRVKHKPNCAAATPHGHT